MAKDIRPVGLDAAVSKWCAANGIDPDALHGNYTIERTDKGVLLHLTFFADDLIALEQQAPHSLHECSNPFQCIEHQRYYLHEVDKCRNPSECCVEAAKR